MKLSKLFELWVFKFPEFSKIFEVPCTWIPSVFWYLWYTWCWNVRLSIAEYHRSWKRTKKESQNHIFFVKFKTYKTYFSLFSIGLVPVNVIVHETSISFPLFKIFYFTVNFADLVTSTLRKENTFFANFPFFPFIKCSRALSLFIIGTAYLSTIGIHVFDTHDSPSGRSLLRHIPEQPLLVIHFETINYPFQSQMFHVSQSCEQLKIITKLHVPRT